MFEEKIIKANEQIKKVVDYLKKHEEAFGSMNLKLYDAFYYFGSDEMKEEFPLTYKNNNSREYDDFYWFCEDSYRLFEEDLKENLGIDFSEMQNYIDKTSSFYLHDCNIIDEDRNGDIDYSYAISEFVNYYCNNQYGNFISFNKNLKILVNECVPAECEDEIDYIINDLYNDVVNYCKDIITVYEIIKNFKDNQVEYFKEYLECQEERLEYEKEEEERIKRKIKIIVQALKKNIIFLIMIWKH